MLVDEAAALTRDPATAELLPLLINQVRGQGIGVLATAQSPSLLGESRDELLSTSPHLFVGRLHDPDALVALAGTRYVPELSHDPATGRTNAREQHAHRLDPQRVRAFPTFRWAIISGQAEAGSRLAHAFVPPLPIHQ